MHGVVRRLFGHADQQGAGALGFDDAERLPVDDQQVVAAPARQRHLAQRNATRTTGTARASGGVAGAVVLNGPAPCMKQRIDLSAGDLFGSHPEGVAGCGARVAVASSRPAPLLAGVSGSSLPPRTTG